LRALSVAPARASVKTFQWAQGDTGSNPSWAARHDLERSQDGVGGVGDPAAVDVRGAQRCERLGGDDLAGTTVRLCYLTAE